MNVETKSISARLRDTRLYYGYKQTEIAKVLGIGKNAYCEYEHYKRVIPLKRLVQLANFYEINIDYLLGLTDLKIEIKPMNLDLQVIGDRLLEIRETNDLSVSGLAKALNIHASLIYYLQSGKRLISTSVCYDIAKKFDLSVDYLLGRTSRKHLRK